MTNNFYYICKAYICTCKTGKRIVGACVHVATILYYLGYAKTRPLHLPGNYLNSLLVDTIQTKPSNDPQYVRRRKTLAQKTDYAEAETPLIGDLTNLSLNGTSSSSSFESSSGEENAIESSESSQSSDENNELERSESQSPSKRTRQSQSPPLESPRKKNTNSSSAATISQIIFQ